MTTIYKVWFWNGVRFSKIFHAIDAEEMKAKAYDTSLKNGWALLTFDEIGVIDSAYTEAS